MGRTILIYAGLLAVSVFALEWVQYQFLARRFGLEIMFMIIAVAFAALGAWVGIILSCRKPV